MSPQQTVSLSSWGTSRALKEAAEGSFVAGGFNVLFTSLSRLGSFGSSVLMWRAGGTCALTVS